MSDELFPEIERRPPTATSDAAVRVETANRTQVTLQPIDLESVLPPGHAARLVWRFVEGLDLSKFYAAIKARDGGPGRPPIDPKILVALWLYATIDGVGSAREVDRLCHAHDAYRWICGGVSVNYHTLSDFRTAQQAALDDLLTQSITVLVQRGIVRLARVAQDGTRIRASAGVGSFRREASLRACAQQAREQVARTKRQAEHGRDRQTAAQARGAADALARVEEALRALPEVQATKTRLRRQGKRASEPRVSTTDPTARVMKMADGGFRPAYNVHFATDMDSRAIVGVAVTTVSDDHGTLVPMLRQIRARTARVPEALVVDGGVSSQACITAAAAAGTTVYAPVPKRTPRGAPPEGTDAPDVPRPTDTPAVAAWRTRMATDEAKTTYRQRGAVAEWINADARTHRTLGRLLVRGLPKVHTWVLWIALAQNMRCLMEIVPHQLM